MICPACKDGEHDECDGSPIVYSVATRNILSGGSCHCQHATEHRVVDLAAYEREQEAHRECAVLFANGEDLPDDPAHGMDMGEGIPGGHMVGGRTAGA